MEDKSKKRSSSSGKLFIGWDNTFKLLEDFYAEHGHILVGSKAIYKGVNLGEWITN